MISFLILIAVGVVVFTWLFVGNIFPQKSNAGTTIPPNHVNSSRTADLDSDSEDEGLFGRQQRSSALFDGVRQHSSSQGSSRNSESLPSTASAKSLGVENVRAMPDATRPSPTDPPKPKKESNLFASDSDEEDLFSSKSTPSGRSTNHVEHRQNEPQVSAASGGLFSSDEDSPLFSSTTPLQAGPKDSKEDSEQPPPLPKESTRKVPVGGVSIFGKAITSALQRRHSTDEELSDDDAPNAEDIRDTRPPPPKPDDKAPHKPASVKMPVKGGLFDSDEDENLFDSLVRKPASVPSDVEKKHASAVPPRSEKVTKNEGKNSNADNKFTSNLSGKDTKAISPTGLFSDEEDSIFAIPTTVKKKDASLPGSESLPEKPPSVFPEATQAKGETAKTPRPPSLFTPPEDHTPSLPVAISEPPKPNHSLFSSPSDDDDDIFSSVSKPVQRPSHASAFLTDPPPLPPQGSSSSSHTAVPSKGSPQLAANDNADTNKSTKVGLEGSPKKSLPSSLFSSTSDEDIFASVTSHTDVHQTTAPQASKEKSEEKPELGTKLDASLNSKNTRHSEVGGDGGLFHSPTDDIFKPVPQPSSKESKQSEVIGQSDEANEGPSKSPTKKVVNSNTNSKDDNLFGSTDDLFGITEQSDEPQDSSKSKEESSAPQKPDAQPQTNSTTISAVSKDADKTATPKSQEGNSKTVSEVTLPPSPSSSLSKSSPAGTQEPKGGVTKPPVGGVALFGAKELAAQINKRKTLLEPPEENEPKIENVDDDIEDSIPQSEGLSKTGIFDDSDDDMFGDSTRDSRARAGSSLYRHSPPPLLPEEEKNHSVKQEPEKVQLPTPKPTNQDGEPKASNDDSSEHKSKADKPEEMPDKEVKPRKKPPIGGVSMFGSGGMGGSELFAKVMQRKSMLAPESDSSEEDTPTEPARTSKPTNASEEEATARPMPAVPRSPVSPMSPVSPIISPAIHTSKSGGEESSVSFDDPASHSNVLLSVNKTRVRGSIKRRPPSRAHRKGETDRSDPADTQDSSSTKETPSTSAVAGGLENTNTNTTASDISKTKPIQPDERLQHPPAGKDQRKVPTDVKENEVGPVSTDALTVTSGKSSNCTEGNAAPVGTSSEGTKEVKPADDKDGLKAPKSALGVSKANSRQTSSLFGGSDSDEDLFGEVKQKQNVKKSPMPSGQSVSKTASKSSRSHSLFEDDDDEDDASIFSVRSETKTTTGASKNVSLTKPKGNLKQSSEPFEDPLLGSLTK